MKPDFCRTAEARQGWEGLVQGPVATLSLGLEATLLLMAEPRADAVRASLLDAHGLQASSFLSVETVGPM